MSNRKRSSPRDGEYSVGYGRPPQHTRFQPGRSGNPKGRPKGSKNFSTVFDEELAQPVTLTENGQRKRMPKGRALAKQLINKALNSDHRAAAMVLDQTRRSEGSGKAPMASVEVGLPENKLVVESLVRRIRLATEAGEEMEASPDKGEAPK
ncbi:hypothetical protein IYX23_07030 [Methylocystis sp. L43]|jgi:hypothetical protein|uniref:DUF5681 domain-containing protein n=1 Tax=unclassified Methylocystis TaxID=2625913 RepID=UPI0018C2A911|nr:MULTISPECIES: DUF5681 domain-containing protein [unclassified Methylocystis]MBG0797425.1 hypothetical protein [Methylocystis sp. L43]MBG0807722.1 hypothetical protein [Methylocystis sp. H15]